MNTDEEENSSQQVIFVTDPKDDDELFEMAKSKKSSAMGCQEKERPNQSLFDEEPTHIFDNSFSERKDVQELFILFKTEKKKIATWKTIMCARKLVYLYWLVQA